MGTLLVKIDTHVSFSLISKKLPFQSFISRRNGIGLEVLLPFVADSTGCPGSGTVAEVANVFLVLECSVEFFAPFPFDAFNVFWIGGGRDGGLFPQGFSCWSEDGLTVLIDNLDWIHWCLEDRKSVV